ncbi:MAG: hypothetical protein LC099_10965 [Anaerolineales bacterium]|nr:hypothetical protein [Anaerolineales bacterium]
MRNFLILTWAFAALLSGCKTKERTYAPPPLADDWSATLTQSGGLAGVLRSASVASNGEYQITDESGEVVQSGTLSEAQLSQLTNLISEFNFVAPKSAANCADCFNYKLEIESGGQKMIVQVDDLSLKDSGAEPLILFLREILDSA